MQSSLSLSLQFHPLTPSFQCCAVHPSCHLTWFPVLCPRSSSSSVSTPSPAVLVSSGNPNLRNQEAQPQIHLLCETPMGFITCTPDVLVKDTSLAQLYLFHAHESWWCGELTFETTHHILLKTWLLPGAGVADNFSNRLLRIYYMPEFILILMMMLREGLASPWFTDKKTKDQRDYITCPISHRQ